MLFDCIRTVFHKMAMESLKRSSMVVSDIGIKQLAQISCSSGLAYWPLPWQSLTKELYMRPAAFESSNHIGFNACDGRFLSES